MIVFLGVKVVLPVFKAPETMPVCPGKILTLFIVQADRCAKDVLPIRMS